jgi:hypothetical protein
MKILFAILMLTYFTWVWMFLITQFWKLKCPSKIVVRFIVILLPFLLSAFAFIKMIISLNEILNKWK